jgi:hypothetical protein
MVFQNMATKKKPSNELIDYPTLEGIDLADLIGSATRVRPIEGLEGMIGEANGKGTKWTSVLWPVELPGQISEVRFEDLSELSVDIATSAFKVLKMPFAPFSSFAAVVHALGSPVEKWTDAQTGNRYATFEAGTKWKYRLMCLFTKADSLILLIMARSDRVRNDD